MAERSLIPISFFTRPSARYRSFPLASIWEDFENELGEPTEQSGLNIWEDEKGNQLNIEAALPGLKPEEIDVTIDKGILHISGEKKEESKDEKRKYYKKTSYSFSYRLPLPANIDEKQEPKATYSDGIIRLAFNKTPQSQTKRIPVKKG